MLKGRQDIWKDTFLLIFGMTTFPRAGLAIPEHVQIFEPGFVLLHPKFSTKSFDYDVALIRVGRRLKDGSDKFIPYDSAASGRIIFSRFVRPVCLPCINGDPLNPVNLLKNFDELNCNQRGVILDLATPGSSVVVTGFGWIGSSEFPRTLQQGFLKIDRSSKCSASVADITETNENARFTKQMFCASGTNKTAKTDSCKGDSGGPVVKMFKDRHSSRHWKQVGIVSWGSGCGGKHPGFYTSVTSIMSWVWSSLNMEAKSIECKEMYFSRPHNYNTLSCPSGKIETKCSIQCKEGYRFISGVKTWNVSCDFIKPDNEEASWNLVNIPVCEEIKCDEKSFQDSQNYDRRSCPQKSLGSTCSIQCKKGYKFSNGMKSLMTSCNLTTMNGVEAEWDLTNAGNCEAITCSRKVFTNSRYFNVTSCPPGKTVGSKCSVECVDGYTINDKTKVWTTSCELLSTDTDAEWSFKNVPSCKAVTCKEKIFPIENHYNITACPPGEAAGSKCTFECKPGYRFNSSIGSWAISCEEIYGSGQKAEWNVSGAPVCRECNEASWCPFVMRLCETNSFAKKSCEKTCGMCRGFISPCHSDPCDWNAVCRDQLDSFTCTCRRDFTGNGLSCKKIMPCDSDPCDPNASCENKNDTNFVCLCHRGYTGDGRTCKKISPCDSNPCDTNASCQNQFNSFICSCNRGFEGDGKTCKKFLPCQSNPCDPNAFCQNVGGDRYSCTCNIGFTGNGRSCKRNLPCQSNPCDPNAFCQNVGGDRYSCTCKVGFTENGRSCKRYLPCQSNPCDPNAFCQNVGGDRYSCTCKVGFTGNGRSCKRMAVWSQWTFWRGCSTTCGNGVSRRTRFCKSSGNCIGPAEETRACFMPYCLGSWSLWTAWSNCPVTCGNGLILRTRSCSDPGNCVGNSQESRTCHAPQCRSIGIWSRWSSWSDCSRTCGGGEQFKTRMCEGIGTCDGKPSEVQKCNSQLCHEFHSISWGDWYSWGGCSVSCGSGTMLRQRDCLSNGRCIGNSVESQLCLRGPCRGALEYADSLVKRIEEKVNSISLNDCKISRYQNDLSFLKRELKAIASEHNLMSKERWGVLNDKYGVGNDQRKLHSRQTPAGYQNALKNYNEALKAYEATVVTYDKILEDILQGVTGYKRVFLLCYDPSSEYNVVSDRYLQTSHRYHQIIQEYSSVFNVYLRWIRGYEQFLPDVLSHA